MKISVIIPLYNKGYSIQRCIDSVLLQTDEPFEVIVVNDGSTDNSLNIVQKKYRSEIEKGFIKVINQENKGVSAARNKGIESCSSEYICLLDADDEWKPEFLKRMSSLIDKCPEAILYSLAHFVSKDGKNLLKPKHGLPDSHFGYVDDFFKASSKGSVVKSSKICVRKKDIIEIGGFPEGVVAGEDTYVWIMLGLKGKIACSMEYLSIVYQQEDNSRKARKTSVPYPFIFFSQKEFIKNNPSLNQYLFSIFYKHFIHSMISLKPKEAAIRLKWYISMYF